MHISCTGFLYLCYHIIPIFAESRIAPPQILPIFTSTMTRFFTFISFLILSTMSLQAGVYEDLEYGDTKQQVTDKLKNCERVEGTIAETMFGRTGLNGTFKIKKDLGGQKFSLYFNWTDDGKLKAITLRSQAISADEYETKLTDSFNRTIELITEIYGEPIMSNVMPPSTKIKEGTIISSHLWHVDDGSLLLGVAKEDEAYHLSIRFLEKRIGPAKQ